MNKVEDLKTKRLSSDMCCCRLAKGDVTPTERFQLQRRLLAQDNIVS